MATEPELTTDIEAILTRYLAIQNEERALAEEKARLQADLKAHLAAADCKQWRVQAGGEALKVNYSRRTEIRYDEELLSKRLGANYMKILAPDMRKIKAALPQIESRLTPVLDQVGSPDPKRVKRAIQDGSVRKEDFTGAFTRQVRETVAVMRDRQAGQEPSAPQGEKR